MSPIVVIALGVLIGIAAANLVMALPIMRRPSLEDRLAPYMRESETVGRMYALSAPDTGGLRGFIGTVIGKAASWLGERLTTDAGVRSRLERLGPHATIERFRAQQIAWTAAGIVLGIAAAIGLTAVRGFHPVVVIAMLVLFGVAGHFFNDWLLTRAVRRREQRILAEFPTIAELLALSITAGESTVDALERICRTTTGELSRELQTAQAEARTGTPLVEALDTMAQRSGVRSLSQFVDGIAVAIARGTPLSEVLRAQAADVRAEGRRSLMELAGRKEVGMLVPVVAFVLPITVIFAVYPSLAVLQLGP